MKKKKMSPVKKMKYVLAGFGVKILVLIWHITSKVTVIGEEEYKKVKKERKPVIFLIWHGRICILPYFFRNRNRMVLISPSDDGELATQILAGLRFQVVRGSSSHPVIRVWRQMKEELEKGGELILVADGPRGPNRKLKPGCLKLAQSTKAYLVPVTFSASRKKIFSSWDSFLFYLPFSRIVAIYGKPFLINLGLDAETLDKERQKIEFYMQNLDKKADRLVD